MWYVTVACLFTPLSRACAFRSAKKLLVAGAGDFSKTIKDGKSHWSSSASVSSYSKKICWYRVRLCFRSRCCNCGDTSRRLDFVAASVVGGAVGRGFWGVKMQEDLFLFGLRFVSGHGCSSFPRHMRLFPKCILTYQSRSGKLMHCKKDKTYIKQDR